MTAAAAVVQQASFRFPSLVAVNDLKDGAEGAFRAGGKSIMPLTNVLNSLDACLR